MFAGNRTVAVLLVALLAGCGGSADGQSTTEADIEVDRRAIEIEALIVEGAVGDALAQASELVGDYETVSAAWYVQGQVFQSVGLTDSAEVAFSKAAELQPGNPAPWHELGNIAAEEQRYADAVSMYRKATSVDNAGPQPWHGLGRAYLEVGNADSARIALERGIKEDPSYPGNYAALSEAYERQGDIPAALENMQKAQKLASRSTEYRSEVGRLHVINGSPDKALAHLEPLLGHPPVKSQTLFALGRALRALGKDAEAENIEEQFRIVSEREDEIFRLEQRVRLTPESIADRLALVDVYRLAGDTRAAINHLLVVESLTEDNAGIQRNLGALYMEAGDSLRAVERFEKADAIEAAGNE